MRYSTWCASLLGIALLLVMSAGSAQAQATRTWVSGVGDDVNPCSRTAPCKTFAGAISKTAPSGEINCLDSGGFGAVTIVKSMTIKCVGVIGGIVAPGTNGITINSAGAKVVLEGLDINGIGSGVTGVRVLAASKVDVINTTISGMTTGITMEGTGAHLFVNNSFIMNNSTGGVDVFGTSNIASITNTSILSNASFAVQANSANAVIGVETSVLNDSPTGISNLIAGGQVVSVGPSNLVTGTGAFTSTVLFK
jgi:hypothetical protein